MLFDHVTIRVSDRIASERFYDTVLRALHKQKTYADEHFAEWDDFSLTAATADKPATRGLHVGFTASTREQVDQFWSAGTTAGYEDDGAPGLRPQYSDDYYGAFLLDPDGNSAEAVHHRAARPGGSIDHLWIRVADLGAATRFYEAVAPHGGFERRRSTSELAQFGGPNSGSFSVVRGEPTQELHMAFPVATNAAVEAFHRALTGDGYRDNGAPGERPIYHPGYYGAFVLDPDGNNVELVNHNRG